MGKCEDNCGIVLSKVGSAATGKWKQLVCHIKWISRSWKFIPKPEFHPKTRHPPASPPQAARCWLSDRGHRTSARCSRHPAAAACEGSGCETHPSIPRGGGNIPRNIQPKGSQQGFICLGQTLRFSLFLLPGDREGHPHDPVMPFSIRSKAIPCSQGFISPWTSLSSRDIRTGGQTGLGLYIPS